MEELNKHVTQMIVMIFDTCFTGQGGGDLTTCNCTQAHNDFFFHTANQTVDSLHNDHSATLHNCINLKTPSGWKALMVCVHVTGSA